jgi:hypothetical protein
MALATTQPVAPQRNVGDLMRIENLEQPIHPIYSYAVISDAEEGLILTDITTFADGEFRNNSLERALTWNEGGVLNGARHVILGGYYAYIATPKGLVIVNLDNPLEPQLVTTIALEDVRASALQFRYLIVTHGAGVSAIDVTLPEQARLIADNTIALDNARGLHLARGYAYVAAGKDGLVIIDMENPEKLKLFQRFTAGGALEDSHDVIVASTNASAFAYVADGAGGLKVLQLTSPSSQPNFYGFNPSPVPQLIARADTRFPALSLSRGLERDRGVDETGGQVAVFGRHGSRPFNLEEMRKLFLDKDNKPWFVSDAITGGPSAAKGGKQ